jgi:GWxTD domain-containing protein
MIIPLIILWLATATQVDKALEAVGQGQAAIEQKKFEEAAQALQGGLPAAAAIEDAETRQQALAAIHFFSALAYSGMEAESEAREQVELFLIQMPKSTSVDKAQYPAPFVATFGEVVKGIRAGAAKDFDKRYPGYRLFSTEEPKAVSVDLWGGSPEYRYLALPDEQARWKTLTTQAEREAFVEEFWARRDPTPGTAENEFRTTFNARVAFADSAFGTPFAERGSLTARGRLLILLGKPRQMLFEKTSAYSEPETWGYAPEQLPVRIRDKSMLFRLVNDMNQDYLLPPSGEYDRVLSSAAEKAVRKK